MPREGDARLPSHLLLHTGAGSSSKLARPLGPRGRRATLQTPSPPFVQPAGIIPKPQRQDTRTGERAHAQSRLIICEAGNFKNAEVRPGLHPCSRVPCPAGQGLEGGEPITAGVGLRTRVRLPPSPPAALWDPGPHKPTGIAQHGKGRF